MTLGPLQQPNFSGFHDTTKTCWVNKYIGKSVKITSAIPVMTDLITISGKVLWIDKFQHRFYAVLEQSSGKHVHVNVDYIFTIEEK